MEINDEQVLAFLTQLHAMPPSIGIEAALKTPGLPSRSTVYRWQAALKEQLWYAPAISYTALGLRTLHLIGTAPPPAARRYAVSGAQLNGQQTYLRCLVPEQHLPWLLQQVHECTTFLTDDGVQTFRGITPARGTPPDARGLLREHPLIIPILAELHTRSSLTELWQRIAAQLRNHTTAYVPPRRVMLRNGKAYVRQALTQLRDHLILHEYDVHYDRINEHTIIVLLRSSAPLALSAQEAASFTTYRTDTDLLIIAHVTLHGLRALITQPITILGFSTREERQRFNYEALFSATGWSKAEEP